MILSRHGVIFQDLSVGQADNVNPLVREVIVSLKSARPWDDINLSNILVEIVSACPDQLPAVLSKISPESLFTLKPVIIQICWKRAGSPGTPPAGCRSWTS